MTRHPFADDPQFEQIYGPHKGPRIGREGNGLGTVWGSTGSVDDERDSDDADILGRRPRMLDSYPSDKYTAKEAEEPDHEHIEEILLGLRSLTPKQQYVIQMRYGLRDGGRYTLEEIAEFMGITHQSVRGIERRALNRLQFVTSGGRNV